MTDQQPIIIKDWPNGIGDSPNVGFGYMKNVDIESYPGAVRTQKKMTSMTNLVTQQPVTFFVGGSMFTVGGANIIAQASTDDGRSNYNGTAVTFNNSGGGLPSPLVANTVYFLSFDTTTFAGVSTTYENAINGVVINFTTTGTGTQTMNPVLMDTVLFMIQDLNTGFIYAQDASGRVWYTHNDNVFNLLLGNTLSSATGNGICLFKVSDGSATYLLVFRNGSIDIINVTATTNVDNPSWTNAWQTMLNTGNRHFPLVGQDNIMYYTDGRFIGSIQEIPGQVFAPGNTSTYNITFKALSLPQNEVAWCLEELGINLLVGGLSFNKIYPWDRSSTSFNLPLVCPENGIYAMKNSGNLVYVFAGTKGNVYRTTGGFVNLFKTIPGYITNNIAQLEANQITWGGIAVRNGALLIGISSTSSPSFNGVYLLYPDGRLTQDNTAYVANAFPTAILTGTSDYGGGIISTLSQDFYKIAYQGGADHSNASRYAQGTYAGLIQSELYRVGNKKTFGKFSRLEIQLARPASTGFLRFSYRRDLSSSFTPLTTFTADGIDTSFTFDCGLTNVENIQVQSEQDGDIELMEVRLIP